MKVDAVKTSPPVGIIMLSVQIIPPLSGMLNCRFGLSSCSCTMSPDQATQAQMSPFASRPE